MIYTDLLLKILTKASFEYLTIASLSPKKSSLQTLRVWPDLDNGQFIGSYSVMRQGSLNVRADAYPVNSLFWSLHLWMIFFSFTTQNLLLELKFLIWKSSWLLWSGSLMHLQHKATTITQGKKPH
jgi:hypothetical protein